jgi:hypothetical protein
VVFRYNTNAFAIANLRLQNACRDLAWIRVKARQVLSHIWVHVTIHHSKILELRFTYTCMSQGSIGLSC